MKIIALVGLTEPIETAELGEQKTLDGIYRPLRRNFPDSHKFVLESEDIDLMTFARKLADAKRAAKFEHWSIGWDLIGEQGTDSQFCGLVVEGGPLINSGLLMEDDSGEIVNRTSGSLRRFAVEFLRCFQIIDGEDKNGAPQIALRTGRG